MKQLSIFLTCLTLSVATAMAKTPQTPAQQLLERLTKITQKGVMYGHQDDTFYGLTWNWDENRSDTYELVGDYPAVMGFDLGGIELANSCNLDSVPFQRIRTEIIKQHQRGGIVTLSWHPRNPLIGTSAWIGGDTVAYNQVMEGLKRLHMQTIALHIADPKTTCASVLQGGTQYDTFQLWLHRVTDFLASLKDEKGQPIPFIFRPWHENNGSWFWWGQKLCTDAEFHALWDMTQDFIAARLPDNIVWSYSPNLQGNWTEAEWLARYPGDERVELIGIDAYQWGSEEDFVTQLTADLQLVSHIAQTHGKLLAITECGYQNSPDATWWTRVFKPTIEPFAVTYFLPWRNFHLDHFGASAAATTAADFSAWAASKQLLFVNDIKKIK